ncbi:MAG: IS1182 family transposase, partial [Planctomycetota bacterium]|nr:IS1182 family transposase [Planctomycetota bacterium]
RGLVLTKKGEMIMAYRYGDRYQIGLLPQSIEDYVASNDPVRIYDAFVDALNLNELGIVYNEHQVGNSEYEPRSMVKLLLYGYSYGFRSSRKLERAVYHNISFIWLVGGLQPDHKTIARFRKDNLKAIKNILKQCAKLCIKLELIEGNTLFVDGSKFRANAGINKTWTKEKCEKYLKDIDNRIEEILAECEQTDSQEQDNPSLVKMKEELKDKKVLKSKVKEILKEIERESVKSLNSTDRDCVKVKSRQGTHAGYNGQIVVDEKHGLIVNSDVVGESTDIYQFANQIEQANQILGQPCKNACGDAGYADTDELKKIDEQSIKVIVPSKAQVHERPIAPFEKRQFRYDKEGDSYYCPAGNKLTYQQFRKDKNFKVYQITDKSLCLNCRYKSVCTKAKDGRRINRLVNEEIKEKIEVQYKQERLQVIYKRRKEKVELPFGHIKRNLGAGAFLLRGLEGVKAEMSLLANCFNITRMINILGAKTIIANLIM